MVRKWRGLAVTRQPQREVRGSRAEEGLGHLRSVSYRGKKDIINQRKEQRPQRKMLA